MVSRLGSPVRSHGRGGVISIHEPTHEEPIQGEDGEEHVREYQEEIHREQKIVFKESDLRHMMQTIIDRLPPIHNQDGARRVGPKLRPKYMNSYKARNAQHSKHHRLCQSSQGVSSSVSGGSD